MKKRVKSWGGGGMLRTLTIERYQCFQKHRLRNLNAYLNIYSLESTFIWKGIQQSSLVTEMTIQKNLKGLERMEILTTSHVKVFLGNKYSYIHTAWNIKVTNF